MLGILYEDNHLIVINKKVGDIVQGDKSKDEPLSEIVKSYIKRKYKKPGAVFLGVIHRLDRPTSGVILFARTSKALVRMNEQFREKRVQKTYWAIVKNKPKKNSGRLHDYLQKNQQKNKSFIVRDEKGKNAILNYRVLKKLDNYYHLEINPETGRHHQIRVQLANIKCPIKGDVKYGFKRSNINGGIDLHAYKIQFLHPVKKEQIEIIGNPPKNILWNQCCK